MIIGNGSTVELLDDVKEMIIDGDTFLAMEELMSGLWWQRSTSPKECWTNIIDAEIVNHSLKNILREDPITDHALRRPRGYPGDADLLDYIYFGEERISPKNISKRGREIFRFLYHDPSCKAVRARMRVIAFKIDETAAQSPGRILSVACGHVREAQFSQAIKGGSLQQFVALDQDLETLNRVDLELSDYGVSTIQESIKNLILKKDEDLGEFDLIYSTGLYDYLADKAAKRLTKRLFSFLAPNGVLLFANALPDIHACGYMEAFMNWNLIYRDENEMIQLLELLNPDDYIATSFKEPNGQIIFTEVRKL